MSKYNGEIDKICVVKTLLDSKIGQDRAYKWSREFFFVCAHEKEIIVWTSYCLFILLITSSKKLIKCQLQY